MRARAITIVATALLAAAALTSCSQSSPPDGETKTASAAPTRSASPTPEPTFTSAAADHGPQQAASGTATPIGDAFTYTVASGDAVTGIANRFGLCVNDIYLANDGIFGQELAVGQQLTIKRTPGPGHTGTTCNDPNPPGHN